MKKFVVCGNVGLATIVEARDFESAKRKAIRFNLWQGVGYRSLIELDDEAFYPQIYEYVSPGKQAQYDRRWQKQMRQMLQGDDGLPSKKRGEPMPKKILDELEAGLESGKLKLVRRKNTLHAVPARKRKAKKKLAK